MKISKTGVTINASTSPEESGNKYDDAINYINSAIQSLGAIAKDDDIAKDTIANLGVILMDLKG